MEYSDLVLSVPFHFFCALPAMYVTYELRNDRVWGRHWMARQVPLVTTGGRQNDPTDGIYGSSSIDEDADTVRHSHRDSTFC